MSGESLCLGIDIGGSGVKVGAVTSSGEVRAQGHAPLSPETDREAGLDLIFHAVETCLSEAGVPLSEVGAVGIAAPGTLDLQAGIVLHPFNLPGWEQLPLREISEARLQRPAFLVNDANAAAYGEYWAGAAREARSLMLWTLGTGIGGGIVLDGELLIGAHGHAAECGHMIIQCEGGRESPHGVHGALELYAGARGLLRRCEEALQAGARSSLGDLAQSRPVTPRDVAAAAEQGDELALNLILETARYIGIGTVNIQHILNPEVVLLGGAMNFGGNATPLGRQFLAQVRATVRERAFPIPASQTRIDFATLGNDAGFIGAAGWAWKQQAVR